MQTERQGSPMDEERSCCCCKKTERSEDERRALMNRLSRIEGQIRGIRGMVEKSAYCSSVTPTARTFSRSPRR